MEVVRRLAQVLRPDLDGDIARFLSPDGGIVECCNWALVQSANRFATETQTSADEKLLGDLRAIHKALYHGKGRTDKLRGVLDGLGRKLGLKLKVKEKETTLRGKRVRIFKDDPGFRFERVLYDDAVNRWLVHSPRLGARVAVADWGAAHANALAARAESTMAATHVHSYADCVDEGSDPLVCPAAGPNDEDPSVHRTVLTKRTQRVPI